jgi:hypothetical protein
MSLINKNNCIKINKILINRKNIFGSIESLLFIDNKNIVCELKYVNKKWSIYFTNGNLMHLNYHKESIDGIVINQDYLNGNYIKGWIWKNTFERHLLLSIDKKNNFDIENEIIDLYNKIDNDETVNKDFAVINKRNIYFDIGSSKNMCLKEYDYDNKKSLNNNIFILEKTGKNKFSMSWQEPLNFIESIIITCFIFLS